jgi:hypothetical protein
VENFFPGDSSSVSDPQFPQSLVMADTFASPLAFELCEGGTCDKPKMETNARNETIISCAPSDNCVKGGCYCQLFKRPKDSADTVAWEVPRINHDKEVQYKPDKFDYKCLCVKPILESDQTIGGVKYTMRFVLCGLGDCGLDSVIAQNVNPLDPNVKARKEFKCSGSCKGDCKCTLFRLQIQGNGFDSKEAKWQYVAKTGQNAVYDDKYMYHCFCVK